MRRLARSFLRVGAVSFGGLGATLALIEAELVQRLGAASQGDVREALTYTKLLPGSTVVQVVAYLGARLGGWRGSAVSTAAFLFPSVVMMLALAYGYSHVATLPALVGARRSVLAVVVGLLLIAMYRLGKPVLAKPVLAKPLPIGIALAALGLSAAKVSAIWIVLGAGLLGLALRRR